MRTRVDWTDERLAMVKLMWRGGYSAGQIAKRLGPDISRSAVMGVIHRSGLARRTGQPPKITLRKISHDRDAILDRWAAGQTATRIASALGIKSLRSVQDAVMAARRRGDPRAVARPKAPKQEARRPVREALPVIVPPAVDYHGPVGTDAVLAIRDAACKWPVESIQSPTFHFCCEPVWQRRGKPTSMYCAYHHRVAYTPITPKERRKPIAPIPRNPTAEVWR